MKLLKFLGHFVVIILLTIFTQIGGLVWLLSLLISFKLKKKKRYTFPVLYLVFNLLLVPPVAKYFGRERLPVFSRDLKPRNLVYPLLYRNYVTLELKILLETSAKKLKSQSIQITYLDANFPFYDGFLYFHI